VVLWGGVYPGAKLGLREIPVLSFTSLRLMLAAAILLVVAGWGGRLSIPRHRFGAVANAALAQTVFQLLLIASLGHTTAGNSAILLATAPLITAAWLAFRGTSPLTRRQLGGVLVGIIGVAFVVQHAGLSISDLNLGGNALALAAAGAWAWYGLAIGPVVGLIGARRATALTIAVAAVLLTPPALPELSRISWQVISWQAWAGLIYCATIGMVIAMALWGHSVSRLGPTQTMVYVYVEPVTAVVLAALVLGESFSLIQGLGAALTLVALWLAQPGIQSE
jgi:drug/metabolite transporter (DMT)-like permease